MGTLSVVVLNAETLTQAQKLVRDTDAAVKEINTTAVSDADWLANRRLVIDCLDNLLQITAALLSLEIDRRRAVLGTSRSVRPT